MMNHNATLFYKKKKLYKFAELVFFKHGGQFDKHIMILYQGIVWMKLLPPSI